MRIKPAMKALLDGLYVQLRNKCTSHIMKCEGRSREKDGERKRRGGGEEERRGGGG